MQVDEQGAPGEHKSRRNFDLVYFERVGERTTLRFTRLAVALILGLTLISVVAILAIFLTRSRPDGLGNVNVNIAAPAVSPYSTNKPIIQRPPPQSSPPKVGKQPAYSTTLPPSSPTPNQDNKEKLTARPPARTSSSESPP
jgi:hypothetical protein